MEGRRRAVVGLQIRNVCACGRDTKRKRECKRKQWRHMSKLTMPPSVVLICSELEVTPVCLLESAGILPFVAPMRDRREDERDIHRDMEHLNDADKGRGSICVSRVKFFLLLKCSDLQSIAGFSNYMTKRCRYVSPFPSLCTVCHLKMCKLKQQWM